MKLRIFPVVLTVIISAAVLFGGWYGYDRFALQSPLEQIVKKYDGVKDAHIHISKDQVNVKVDLEPNTDLRGLVQQISTEGKSVIGSRKLNLDIEDHSNKKLDEWWSKALFSVAESMASKQYSQIPVKLQQLAKNYGTLQVTTDIDDNNVYVSLKDGKASKFIILPRNPEKMGVWPNA
ncbi:hypothetical protein PASE110613_01170 [Paenibacillus sediminis]|uniref:DUF2140 family protein n=1 Tax=Paenibacillus sediminis TaxID=664909 RepID=A0ABS4GZU9_9BACL|nr:hypothetical protein [Paenibacillus sediminis]MBP1935807.1 hypothetical protein [Paenibacillus sediminis]